MGGECSKRTMNAVGKIKSSWLFDVGNGTSILAIPSIVLLVISYYLARGIKMTHPRYGTRCELLAVALLLFLVGLFIYHQRKLNIKTSDRWYISCRPITVLVVGVFIGLYLTYTIWGSGYLSLMPYEKIDNGVQHIDTLFHSSIAESWKRSGYPSTLLNDERYLSYHTFSHLIIGVIAGLMHIPSFVAYNFLYPVLFLPLYCLAILLAVSAAKYYFEGKAQIRFLDIVVIGLFIFGVTDSIALYGIVKRSYFVSESFLVANTLSFLSYAITFYMLKKHLDNGTMMTLYGAIIVPVEIFIVSWTKISVGFVFMAGASYLVFRHGIVKTKLWLLDVVYVLDFLLCYKLFSSYVSNENKGLWLSMIKLFPLRKFMGVGSIGILGHYLILSLMTILFVWMDIKRNKYKWQDIKKGKTIWIEYIAVMSILAFIPSAVFDLGFSDTVYFSYTIEVPALVLLCGHNYIDIENDAKGMLRPIVYVVCFGWVLWMGYHHMPNNPIALISNQHSSHISDLLLTIREEVKENPEEYTIYLDPDCFLLQVYPRGKETIFICPAMTGVGVINATYLRRDRYYDYTGKRVYRYGMDDVENGRMSYEEAIHLARDRGKKKIIHFMDDGYKIVDID